MTISLVILLHGVGSRGADLAALGPLLQTGLPGAAFEAPDAPDPFVMGGPGRQWFSVSGVTEANRAARVKAARPGFDAVVTDLIAKHGLTDHPEQVAFVGFSQGTIMVLDAVASGRWAPGAVVGFSGRLATPDPLTPAPDTRLLLIHGEADGTIPAAESQRAQQRLAAAGAHVDLKLLPGLGHSINRAVVDLATRHLALG